MSKRNVDSLMDKEVRKLGERVEYYEQKAIPYYSSQLHEALDNNIELSTEVSKLREQVNSRNLSDTAQELLLDYVVKLNENSKFEAIKESIENNDKTIDGSKNHRSKSNGRKK